MEVKRHNAHDIGVLTPCLIFSRTSITDGTPVELGVPEQHQACELHAIAGVVLRCVGCCERRLRAGDFRLLSENRWE